MNPRFISQVDGPDYSIHTVQTRHGVWTLVAHAHGWSYLIDDEGGITHCDTLDSRGESDAEEVLAWIADHI